jgi:hypothetical protein
MSEKPHYFLDKNVSYGRWNNVNKKGKMFSTSGNVISFVPFCPMCFIKKTDKSICKKCIDRLKKEYGEAYEIIINSMFMWRQTHNPNYFNMYCLVYPNMKKHLDKTGKLKFSPSTT